ncbi:MAG TPA: alpha/beta hydrolase [Mycobacterium sp.]|uniref:alpha/beta fold hydrolase n=1 Tax=Mycobacterium sp. TaxID=1785 RepID=UPI002CCF685F|nr:alpha/beta hydrolase [Mycobacterium sp.]HME77915.1 alpha/beta hydrolase [Mycobacterium sp.]
MKPSNPMRKLPRVQRVETPRAEGQFRLSGGRQLGYAEFADPAGAVVLWFHGTLGARRQFPLLGRRAAERLGLRVIIVEQPGTWLSDAHRYPAVFDWVADMAQVADALEVERLGIVGLSGGGFYALACGTLPPLVARVAAVAILDGVVPSVGPEATSGGITDTARRFAPILTQLRRPLAMLCSGLLAPLIPIAHYAYRGYTSAWPADDQRVLADPEIEAIFVDDMVNAFRGRCPAMVDDARLLGRDWGFRLADVKVPVRWWHGDSDHVVPIAGVEAAVSRLQDAELTVRSGESHLGGFAKIDEVLECMRAYL